MWMEPAEAPVPRALAATGHKAMIYREPYGVTLVIGPFNGPLTLLIDGDRCPGRGQHVHPEAE